LIKEKKIWKIPVPGGCRSKTYGYRQIKDLSEQENALHFPLSQARFARTPHPLSLG
jgi:hypothetical protein